MPKTYPPANPVQIMRNLGLEPDPWQIEVLENPHPRLLLNCARQAGKSTVVAVLALVQALFIPYTRVLILSRSDRQAKELYRQVVYFHKVLGARLLHRCTASELEFTHFSRIVSRPCREDTIRGFAKVDLLLIDEAARVPDYLYKAVSPMLAVSNGRMICLSTPYGKRGFFYDAWANGGDDWARIEIAADKVPRISADFLAKERRRIGESWFRQEYFCSFEALEGLVYPDFAKCLADKLPPHLEKTLAPQAAGRVFESRGSERPPVGGLDFGFRNPFAALWGSLDRDGILWLTGEHYARYKPISHHVRFLPKDVTWYADPSGASEIAELHRAGFCVKKGNNILRTGIAAVSARLENGTLKVVKGRCPNLLAEAALYRYSDDPADKNAETPLDQHNHALAALRYLIATLDARKTPRPDPLDPNAPGQLQQKPRERSWAEQMDDDSLWIPLH